MDFTLVAANALDYATKMYPTADITCLYCMSNNLNNRAKNVSELKKSKTSLLAEELGNLVKDVLNKEEIPNNIFTKIEAGEAIETIRKVANDLAPDFIIMGTRDKYNLFNKWLGTVTLGVIKTCKFPTILIPKHAKFNGINKTLVASDSHFQDPKALNWLKNWNHDLKSFIKFLHVQVDNKRDVDNIAEGIVTSLFQNDDAEFSFEIENIKSENLVDGLLSKAYNMGADLIVAAPDDQNFLQSLLYKSVSKDLILKSKIPLLFLKFFKED